MSIMRNNIILGIILSIGITIMVMLPRLSLPYGVEHIDTLALHTFTMLIISWFGQLCLLENKKYRQTFSNIWVRSIVAIAIITVAVHYLLQFISIFVESPQFGAFVNLSDSRIQTWNFIRVLIWNVIYYWILFSQKISVDKKNAEIEARRANELALEAKLTSFREQLSPHFMFNALNTLSSMSHDVAVQNFIDKLAGVYRYLLITKEQKMVSVQEELNFSKQYWHILKERFGDAIELKISLVSNPQKLWMPPMTLQTLIENAIKHNKATLRTPLQVSIIEENDYIIVSNPIQPKTVVAESTGIGLQNLVERYQLLFDKEVVIVENENFIVKLPIINA